MTKVIELSYMINGMDGNHKPCKTIQRQMKEIIEGNQDYKYVSLICHKSNSDNMEYASLIVDVKEYADTIPEYVFYNKELSDTIRDIVKNSACDFEQAERLIAKSKDHARDSELIKKLKNCGMSERRVAVFISAINND